MFCKLCKSLNLAIEYSGPIRSGGANSKTEEGFKVFYCLDCDCRFLYPAPSAIDEYYSKKDYWEKHHGKLSIRRLQQKLDPEQFRWKSEIEPSFFRNKVVVDYGCGCGLFLDGISKIACKTIGIDKAGFFADHLHENGHLLLTDIGSLKTSSIDTIVTFDTLEHLENPTQTITQLSKVLKQEGDLFIGVPNFNDFLKKLVPAYLPFFYHKSHLFYFTEKCLKLLIEKSKMTHISTVFVHKYNIENSITWARESKPQGKIQSSVFDKFTEDTFRTNIERQGLSSHILIHAKKQTKE